MLVILGRFVRQRGALSGWSNTSIGRGDAAPGATSWDSTRIDAFATIEKGWYHTERIEGIWARTSTDRAFTGIGRIEAGGFTETIGKPAAVSTGFGKMSIFAVSAAADHGMIRVYYPWNPKP